MKKLFYLISLTATLAFAAGCAKEVDIDPVKGDLVETTFTVTLDDATATKAAIGNDAAKIDKLLVAAFRKSDGSYLSDLNENNGNFEIGNVADVTVGEQTFKQFSVKAKLVRNFEYKIAFFAYHNGAPYTLGDDGVITMAPTADTKANDETLDAFYAAVEVKLDPADDTSMSKSVTLTRPLAQVNILSDPADWAAATTSGITADALQSSVSIANAPNKLNLLDGAVSGDVTLAYALNAIPEGTINVAAANATAKDAKYIAMAYVLSDDTGKNFNVTFSVPAIAAVNFGGFERTVNNMPAKRNYRTNLHGDLFTVSGDFTVTIDPAWGGNDDNQDINIPQPTVSPAPSIPDGITSANPGIVQPTISTGNNINITTASPALYFGIDSNSDGAISYASSNTSVGTISDAGVFTVVGAGDTDVTIHQMAGDQTKAIGDPLSDITIVYHVHVEAVAPTTYAITKADTENGTITVKIGDDEVTEAAADAIISVIATPADGYQIATLTYTPVEEAAVNIKDAPSFTMPAKAVTVAATFEPIPPTNYSITVTQPLAGGTISASAGSAAEGAEITLSATPATGYQLSSWSVLKGADVVTVSDNKFTMPAGDVTVTATFAKINYTISTGTLSGGSLSASATANYGDEVTVTVTPADGKQLKTGTLKYTPEGGSATAIDESTKKFSMPAANVTLSAEFEDIPVTTYGITITGSGLSSDKATAAAGETVTLTISPAEHYRLSTLTVLDGVANDVAVSGTGNTRTFTMPASDVTAEATFEEYYTVTVTQPTGGTISLKDEDNNAIELDNNTAEIVVGEYIQLVAAASTGYTFTSWSVKQGSTDVEEADGLFEMPAGNVTVTATFTEDTPTPSGYSITFSTDSHGAFSEIKKNDSAATLTAGALDASEGDVLTFKFASSDDDYAVNTVKVGETTLTANASGVYSYTVGTSNATVAGTTRAKIWRIVSSESSLAVGDKVVFVDETAAAVAGDISSQIMVKVDLVEGSLNTEAHTISSLPSGAVVMTLGKSEDNWTFTKSSGNVLAATAVKKVAWTGGTNTWTISISEGSATVSNTTEGYGRFLYNNTNPRFTTYTSDVSTSMRLISIYRYE